MGYARNKLKPRLNSGMNKMYKKKGGVRTDFHDHITDPTEVGIQELADIFFVSKQTIITFKNANILKEKRKEGRAKVFDRESSISILKLFEEDGHLTTKDMYTKKRKLNIK